MKPNAPAAMFNGAWRFALVSILGFSPWAFNQFLPKGAGEAGLYVACLIFFLLAAEIFLVPLVHGPGRFKRFNYAFGPAFVAYAIVWSACWFALRSTGGEIAGAILGCALFTWIIGKHLGSLSGLAAAIAIMILAHSAGYWLGGYVFSMARNPPSFAADWPRRNLYLAAKLCWGLFYGLGFGAGIGYAFWRFQQKPAA